MAQRFNKLTSEIVPHIFRQTNVVKTADLLLGNTTARGSGASGRTHDGGQAKLLNVFEHCKESKGFWLCKQDEFGVV
jgi:hypothetical protein